jgi:hypothetical protein
MSKSLCLLRFRAFLELFSSDGHAERFACRGGVAEHSVRLDAHDMHRKGVVIRASKDRFEYLQVTSLTGCVGDRDFVLAGN